MKELKQLEFLKYANNMVDKTDRYFKYPWIYSDIVQGHSHHIAYPFFNRFVGDRERQSILHHMIRVWFQLMESYGYQSWINYGSLLGWKFNGLNMPWDTDIDIQMPIQQLNRLAQELNKTLILENPRFGNSRYWLEVSPTFIRQGNSKTILMQGLLILVLGYTLISVLCPMIMISTLHLKLLKSLSQFIVKLNWQDLNELGPIQHAFLKGFSLFAQ